MASSFFLVFRLQRIRTCLPSRHEFSVSLLVLWTFILLERRWVPPCFSAEIEDLKIARDALFRIHIPSWFLSLCLISSPPLFRSFPSPISWNFQPALLESIAIERLQVGKKTYLFSFPGADRMCLPPSCLFPSSVPHFPKWPGGNLFIASNLRLVSLVRCAGLDFGSPNVFKAWI